MTDTQAEENPETKNVGIQSEKSLETEKQNLLDRLDRVLEWIKACDTKASILLATIGLIMTVFSSEFFFRKLKLIVKYNFIDFNFSKFLFIGLTFVFFILFLVGIVYLVLELNPSLVSKRNNNENIESTYYFESISKKELSVFRDEIRQISVEDEINDIVTQLYINSKICTKKYQYIKIGIFCSMLGTFGIAMMFAIGWIILIAN